MKARTIKKLRKKISKKGYYKKRLDVLTVKLEYWNIFNTFKCDSFFVGSARANYNQLIYDANQPRLSQKADWYLDKIQKL